MPPGACGSFRDIFVTTGRVLLVKTREAAQYPTMQRTGPTAKSSVSTVPRSRDPALEIQELT